ncbi:MAG TPA: peptidase, partial [Chloroflexaceae bacterium]|nr:peptidase [Chloroflexaceae bacterium]
MAAADAPARRRIRALGRPLLLALAVCALLTGSALPLAVAPPARAPAPTPACPERAYPDATALLAALPGAGYDCAEQLAAALRPLADPGVADALLLMAGDGPHRRARRNAVRALGRLAEGPRGSRARELVLRARGAAVQTTAAALLAREADNFLLQDVVWLLDSFFYPSYSAGPALEGVAARAGLAPALRYRAAAARARLVFARPGPLTPADRAFVLKGLRSDDPGVRAAAATAVARLREGQLVGGARDDLAAALAAAWAAEPPLALAPDAPDPRDVGLLGFQESSPTSLTARAAIARARDRLVGGSALAELRAAYERLALPYDLTEGDVALRTGLPPDELPALLAELA